ncbi:MAG: prenyltransferase/squalene oxidase repeat-containing protein [Chthoniobacteraceae bacterium]
MAENVEHRTSNIEHRSDRIDAALRIATGALLAEVNADGHWTGELSSSALSTATAVVALATVDRAAHGDLIRGGLRWLSENQNADGGWGDTTQSKSNISTTALCWAAFGAAGADEEYGDVVRRAAEVLGSARVSRAGCGVPPQRTFETGREHERHPSTADALESSCRRDADTSTRDACAPRNLVAAIKLRYGKDHTFSVPILMTLALSGRIGWEHTMPLPFELASLPHQVFGALRLPVVSYALPALIAIGQVIHHHRPTRNPLARLIRSVTRTRTLAVLATLQPENGGFLEATPLTSFVTMSLAAMGERDHIVARKGAEFLRASVRKDGSWAIDTNLATWTTTLAIKALAHQPTWASPECRMTLREWLLGQQYRVEHPYTHAAPGGWAWTDLPGGVPDADDTAGALLALLALGAVDSEAQQAGIAGVRWLLDLQNRDGGIPTFCRGWGALPFDRSSQDLTAHTLRAWSAWLPNLDARTKARTLRAIGRGLRFLARTQRDDGAWLPLWFGNEHAPDDENPVHGTAHVVIALRELRHRGFEIPDATERRALAFLAARQRADGGWSGAKDGSPSVEETALAVEALAGTAEVAATNRGVAWLVARVESGEWREPAPIGFYFAKLWYHERLYPMIWTVGALGKAVAGLRSLNVES